MRKLAVIILMGTLIFNTSCLEDLLDPDLKELEPYIATWNVSSIKAYTLYTPDGQEPTRSQERDYTNVSGTIKLTKDKDSDDSYRRGSYDLNYTSIDIWSNEYQVSVYDEFKWDTFGDNGSIYVELDDSEGSTLGQSTIAIDFLWKVELTDDTYVFGMTIAGDGYTSHMVEFTCTK